MFECLPLQDLYILAGSMVKERHYAGSIIFRELHSDSAVYFLLSGQVELTVTTQYAAPAPSGHNDIDREVLLEYEAIQSKHFPVREVKDHFRLGPNDCFGEMSLFTSDTLRATAVAITDTCALRIPSAALHQLLASNKRLQEFVAMTAVDRLRETEAFCHCTPSTVARLVNFMTQAEFEAGDILFNDVDALCPIYFVVLGSVEISDGSGYRSISDGPGVIRRVVGANGLLGTEHLLHGRAVTATATALERTTVLVVQRTDIDKLCAFDEGFRQALISSALGNTIDPVQLQEGAGAPSKFGCSALEDMGWRRHRAATSLDVVPVPKKNRAQSDLGLTGNSSMRSQSMGNQNEFMDNAAGVLTSQGLTTATHDENADADDLQVLLHNADAAAAAEHGYEPSEQGHGHGRGVQAAVTIWMGILIDGVPESLVMGILVNTATSGTLLAFVVGVFLANFPEAMSSAGTMRAYGMRKTTILTMWASITIMTGIGAFAGAAIFPPGSSHDPSVQKIIAAIEGLCGGAMLCMIANTVLPEAFEQGGNVTGLSTLMGFLVAVAVSASQ